MASHVDLVLFLSMAALLPIVGPAFSHVTHSLGMNVIYRQMYESVRSVALEPNRVSHSSQKGSLTLEEQ
jgi:hypothetical protein